MQSDDEADSDPETDETEQTFVDKKMTMRNSWRWTKVSWTRCVKP